VELLSISTWHSSSIVAELWCISRQRESKQWISDQPVFLDISSVTGLPILMDGHFLEKISKDPDPRDDCMKNSTEKESVSVFRISRQVENVHRSQISDAPAVGGLEFDYPACVSVLDIVENCGFDEIDIPSSVVVIHPNGFSSDGQLECTHFAPVELLGLHGWRATPELKWLVMPSLLEFGCREVSANHGFLISCSLEDSG
jgi:hypothetical protein